MEEKLGSKISASHASVSSALSDGLDDFSGAAEEATFLGCAEQSSTFPDCALSNRGETFSPSRPQSFLLVTRQIIVRILSYFQEEMMIREDPIELEKMMT